MNSHSDIVIAGAGPAGITTSLFLCKEKIPHVLLEKEKFPRDKICGDALSGKVIDVLKKLDENLAEKINEKNAEFLGSYGVKFVAPNGSFVDIPFSTDLTKLKSAPGFISKRIHFDHHLFKEIDHSFATVIEHADVKEVKRDGQKIRLTYLQNGIENEISCRLIVGAEGDRSMVARNLSSVKKESEHYCAGLRAYYKGVKNFHQQNFIELHFLKELLPGYLWIFPLPNGEANVGVGMLSSVVSEKKINLRQLMLDLIKSYAPISERFESAELIGDIKGWGLPLGTKKRKISGDNFLLVGDAAALIDPFTGEGIGNGMISGMMAAKQIKQALASDRFDKSFLSAYDKKTYDALWSELKLSRKLQSFAKYEWPFNMVVNNASKNKEVRDLITCMFEDVNLRVKLSNPKFYFRLLFNKN
jgi:geranylgeranyl reductase family protein